jgi:hypothetical protein
MKTKTLLMAAATLAAGVIGSQAAVYSQNIVGYVNTALPASQYTVLSTPLTEATNTADYVFPNAQGGDEILIFTNGQFTTYTYGFDINTFVNDWQPFAPALPAGQAFYYYTGGGLAETNTFTGTVALTNSVSFPDSQYVLSGSVAPIAGGVTNANINIPASGSGESLLIWNGSTYVTYVYGFDINTFQVDWQPSTPNLNVAQGFFYYNNSGATEIWNQSVTVP